MDFPADASRYRLSEPSERSWRRTAIVTGIIATVELVALLVVALAFVAKPFADDASRPARSGPGKETGVAEAGKLLPRAKTPVLVLNGNNVAGSAGTAAKSVRRLGYPVASVGNAARGDFPRTMVMYREGARPAGVRLAKDLGFQAKRAVPLDGMRQGELHGAVVAVIVGRQ